MHSDELYEIFLQNPHVETDTRKLKEGDIFFALKGPNYNGNHYTKQAIDAGASWCISDETTSYKNDRVLIVKDSLFTLQQLAKKHRLTFTIPFIAITGSN
ncbi:MAG TPA: Mur ligase domain-containing protein, partial [Ferruginibacter sp.]|nr:Mur ligase domain-containing protein [Ferruginibacter sp.]